MVQRTLVVTTLICCLFASLARAQGAVTGRVTDPLGGAVSNAAVSLTGPGLSSPQTTQSGSDGSFSLAGAPAAGTYVLTVDAPGFQRWSRSLDLSGTPAPVIRQLQDAIIKALANDSLQERMVSMGLILIPGGPEQVVETIRAELKQWGQVIRDANIRPE